MTECRRDHRYPWYPPIPRYNANDQIHQHLTGLARDAETTAAAPEAGGGFQQTRRHIRRALTEQGINSQVDEAVDQLLAATT